EDGPMRAVPPQILLAPLAHAAIEVDLADDPPAQQILVIRLDDFADELVSRCTGEAVVSALQLQIGVADSGEEHADERESRRPGWLWGLLYFDTGRFEGYPD